jgi:cellulose synthase/poly-beta-1,6-N-acetylglucosamine synthase-like glycosyltransferase
MIIELVFAVLVFVHTIPFLTYILYMRSVTLRRPSNIRVDFLFEPEVSVLMPVLNEAQSIASRLDNIIGSGYSPSKLEILVIDNGSTDGTLDIVETWRNSHREVATRVLVENRRGMVYAENAGLEIASKPVIAKSDADSFWTSGFLKKLVAYLADPSVGVVSGAQEILSKRRSSAYDTERAYRHEYRWLRLGECKLASTVLLEGELAARTDLLRRVGGFDPEMGCDDVALALRMMANGYRAIWVDEARFLEMTPFTWSARFRQKIRRGRHVAQSLWKYKHLVWAARPRIAGTIVLFELYIYVFNPLVFISLVTLTGFMLQIYPALLLAGTLLLLPGSRKLLLLHLSNMVIMICAILGGLALRSASWSQVAETRWVPSREQSRVSQRTDIALVVSRAVTECSVYPRE